MVVDMVRVESGFVKYRDAFPGRPAAYFADVTQPLFVVKVFILVFQTSVDDGVLRKRLPTPQTSIQRPTSQWVTAFFSSTLATNLLGSGEHTCVSAMPT